MRVRRELLSGCSESGGRADSAETLLGAVVFLFEFYAAGDRVFLSIDRQAKRLGNSLQSLKWSDPNYLDEAPAKWQSVRQKTKGANMKRLALAAIVPALLSGAAAAQTAGDARFFGSVGYEHVENNELSLDQNVLRGDFGVTYNQFVGQISLLRPEYPGYDTDYLESTLHLGYDLPSGFTVAMFYGQLSSNGSTASRTYGLEGLYSPSAASALDWSAEAFLGRIEPLGPEATSDTWGVTGRVMFGQGFGAYASYASMSDVGQSARIGASWSWNDLDIEISAFDVKNGSTDFNSGASLLLRYNFGDRRAFGGRQFTDIVIGG